MKKVLASLFTLVLMVSSAYAQNGMENVKGTVASLAASSVTLTSTGGKKQTVRARTSAFCHNADGRG
jgi:hypothetical protein